MEQSTTKDAMQVNTSKADDAASEVLGDVITAQVNTLSPEEDRRILRKIDFRYGPIFPEKPPITPLLILAITKLTPLDFCPPSPSHTCSSTSISRPWALLPFWGFEMTCTLLAKITHGPPAFSILATFLDLSSLRDCLCASRLASSWRVLCTLDASYLVRVKLSILTDFAYTLRGLWAAILMLMSTCTNASGLWAARFFLGAVEAAMAPGMALIIGMWYKRSEQPVRQAAWFMGNVIGGTIGGVLAYGVGHVNGIAPWKVSTIKPTRAWKRTDVLE